MGRRTVVTVWGGEQKRKNHGISIHDRYLERKFSSFMILRVAGGENGITSNRHQ